MNLIPSSTPIDGLRALEEPELPGTPGFVTLLTGSSALLAEQIRTADENRLKYLQSCAYITPEDTPALRQLIQTHHLPAIVGTTLTNLALEATLTALIAEDRAATERLITNGMNVLTQAARSGGIAALTTELAERVGDWVVLIDPHGTLIASAGAGRLHIDDAVSIALGRNVRVRHHELLLYPVGTDRDPAGYLIISTRSKHNRHTRDLASLAAGIFHLLLRSHNPSLTDQLGREALLEKLLEGGDTARSLLRRWNVHEKELTAFELGSKTRTIDIERILTRWFQDLRLERLFAATTPQRIRGFIPNDRAQELAELVREFTPVAANHLYLGLGSPSPIEQLSQSSVQAHQALITAQEQNLRVVSYPMLPTVQLVIRSLDNDASDHLRKLLEPLRDKDGKHAELTETLRVFLATGSAHRKSAEILQIHRQTLVSRLRKIESLTGLSLDSPDDRATAWLALRASGH